MSYKDELKKQIEQLETSLIVDKVRLNQLYQTLNNLNIKERTDEAISQQQLLQG